jgi:hypothetical protein
MNSRACFFLVFSKKSGIEIPKTYPFVTVHILPLLPLKRLTEAQCSSTPRRALLLGSFQTSSACPSGKTNLKMGMEHWWNDNDKGKTKVLGGEALVPL